MNMSIGWAILLLCLLALAYTMKVIKNEKSLVLKDPLRFSLYNLEFLLPKWWNKKEILNNHIRFDRADTRYDWYCEFKILNPINFDLQKTLMALLQEQNLLFDSHEFDVTNLKNESLTLLRVEGTATEDSTNRVYIDAAIIKDEKNEEILFCYNRSGILNGGIEGPYFELALKNIFQNL